MQDSDAIWKKITEGVFIVAEIGKNFIQTPDDRPVEEYLANAKKLVQAAKEAGADAVKFQTHNVEDEQLNILVTAPHFSSTDRYAWVKRNTEATPLEFWRELKAYADSLGIMMFTTPMSRGAAQEVNSLVPLWKVASSDILDFVLLDYLAQTGKPIIISSGMSTEDEIDVAVAFLKNRTDKIILMHCVSKYPSPPDELCLDTIPYLAKRYQVPVGFSDHSLDILSPAAAVNKGAVIIEKHFSLDRNLWGSDHKVSMLPMEFAEMVKRIRDGKLVDASPYGQGVKIMDKEEKSFRAYFRKSLIAGQDIPKGAVITTDMLYAMRPQQWAGGLPSEEYENVLGKKTAKDLKKYDPITSSCLSLY